MLPDTLLSIPTAIVTQLGISGLGGFLVGYLAKKLLKVLAVVAGLFAAGLLYLSQLEVISINYDRLSQVVNSLLSWGQQQALLAAPLVSGTSSQMLLAGSFLVGFSIGFKKG